MEEFDKITDPAERAKVIEQAPPDQKQKLKERDFLHQELLSRLGGEAGLKRARETQVARARGLWGLESAFEQYGTFWAGYVGDVLDARL